MVLRFTTRLSISFSRRRLSESRFGIPSIILRTVRVVIGRRDENIRTAWMRRRVKVVRRGKRARWIIRRERERGGERGCAEEGEEGKQRKRVEGREQADVDSGGVVRGLPLNKCDRSSKLVAKLYVQTGRGRDASFAQSFWRNYRPRCHASL